MRYRNRKAEQCVLNFYKTLPKALRQFSVDIREFISTLKTCTIYSYQEFAERHNISVGEVIAYCESETGCTHKHGDKYIVMFNDSPDIPQERKTFTLAHELGHILLRHLIILESYKIYHSSYPNQHFEQDANSFAACLLCPMPVLSKLKPKSVSAIRASFGLSFDASSILFGDYLRYDKYHNITWHNDMLNLFDIRNGAAELLARRFDYMCEAGETAPAVSKPKIEDYRSEPTSVNKIHKKDAEESMPPELFERLEHDWLYPEKLGLS